MLVVVGDRCVVVSVQTVVEVPQLQCVDKVVDVSVVPVFDGQGR